MTQILTIWKIIEGNINMFVLFSREIDFRIHIEFIFHKIYRTGRRSLWPIVNLQDSFNFCYTNSSVLLFKFKYSWDLFPEHFLLVSDPPTLMPKKVSNNFHSMLCAVSVQCVHSYFFCNSLKNLEPLPYAKVHFL